MKTVSKVNRFPFYEFLIQNDGGKETSIDTHRSMNDRYISSEFENAKYDMMVTTDKNDKKLS